MARVKYSVLTAEASPTSDVFQTVALKVGMQLAYDLVNLAPSELMQKYQARSIRVEELRRAFKPKPPFINGNTTDIELADLIGDLIASSLHKVRGS